MAGTRILETKVFDVCQLANGYVYMDHNGSVAVLPEYEDGSIVLVKQHRPVTGRLSADLIECIAGKLDVDGEFPIECALREMKEEAGLACTNITKLTEIWVSPGCSNEKIHIFKATGLTACDRPPADDNTRPVTYTREQAKEMIASGEICDAKTIIAVLMG